MIKIGVKAKTYRENRNFSGLDIKNFIFVKVWDLYKLPAFVYFKIFGKPQRFWLNMFWKPWSKSPKIYHFFNAINIGNQCWVVTTEGSLPRGAHQIGKFKSENKYINKCISRLVHPSCKKIIAISQLAFDAQTRYLESRPADQKLIIEKMVVWHPAQKLFLENIEHKSFDGPVLFTFVGADFFRKGGMEILLAFDQLFNESLDIRLTIVSSLNYGDYASGSTEQDVVDAKKIITLHSQITHLHSLPNDQIIELFKSSHIGLLPSYEETYGYSVLEAQAAGCPVITTNGTAFPEINNDDCGWIIRLPLDDDRRTVPRVQEHRSQVRKIIVEDLSKIIRQVVSNRKLIQHKAANSIERIRKFHSVDLAKERLTKLYQDILSEK